MDDLESFHMVTEHVAKSPAKPEHILPLDSSPKEDQFLPSGSLVQSHPISFPSLILSNPVIAASRTVIDGESSWT